MKVLALVILIIGTSSGLGSGPYLPSGWKPSGPAFYLPTEIEKPAAVSVEASISQETETSGSSFLKEYGPPKVEVATETSDVGSLQEYEKTVEVSEVLQDITQQSLPELITEQAFVEANAVQENVKSAEISEEVSQVTLTEETATTDSEADTEVQAATEAAIEGKTAEVEDQTESSLLQEVTEVKTEEIQETENANSNLVTVEQKIEEEVREEGKAVEEVKNIAEALINLENEVKAQEVQAIQEVTELKTVQESSRSLEAPEGFLEYGPPGFTEYGPPKGNLRTEVAAEENSESALETNETRRRRFSPKFKASNRKH